MFKLKLFTAFLFIKSLFCPCHSDVKTAGFEKGNKHYRITKIGKLPKFINESSGLELGLKPGLLLTFNDSGGENALYQVSKTGTHDSTLCCFGKNKDWEDIARDNHGAIYIGDFGNNYNNRKDLCVYKFKPGVPTDTIRFSFSDQQAYPPAPEKQDFDCEAMFWHRDTLYLVSKNRGNKHTKVYQLPANAGEYTATIHQTITLKGPVTAADISPDGQQIVFLSYGRIYIFDNGSAQAEPTSCLRFARGGLSEGVVFINNSDFIVSNENRTLFRVSRKK